MSYCNTSSSGRSQAVSLTNAIGRRACSAWCWARMSSALVDSRVPSRSRAEIRRPVRRWRWSRPFSLLLHHRDPHLRPDLGMDLDADLKIAQLTDRLVQIDLALIDVDAELLELALDVARGDGAVELLFLAHLDREGELHVGELRRFRFGRGLLAGTLFGEALALVDDLLLVRLGRQVGEPLGEQVIAGVAVLHLHDFPNLAQMFHVFPQNDFHRLTSLVCVGSPRRAAAGTDTTYR